LNSLQKTLPSNPEVKSLFASKSIQALGNITNASADSFYSSQGRITTLFRDENEQLIENIRKLHPESQTFEMETFLLNHLAKSANESQGTKDGQSGVMRTGAAQMV
jgi:uridine phosphorylase